MSERHDDGPERDSARDDTVPEAPAQESASEKRSSAEEPSGAPPSATTTAPDSAAHDDGRERDDTTLVDEALPLQEAPERAGRRVARSGMRLGTRLALGLLVASLLPTALAASAVLLLKAPPTPMPSPTPASDLLTLPEVRAAIEELKVAEAAFAQASDAAAAAAKKQAAAAARAAALAEESARLAAEASLDDEDERPAAEPSAVVEDSAPSAAGNKPGTAAVVDEAATATAPSLDQARAVLRKAALLAPVREQGTPVPAADIEPVRVRLAVGALVLALFAAALLGRRLRRDLTRALASLDARLRLLASGQPSERAPETLPSELAELNDAVDALSTTLGAMRARDDADRRRAERVFSLAERLDDVARGQLAVRLPSSDDVAEASLAASVNRMIDAFERQVVRLKSHARLLSSGSSAPAFHDDDESDPAALVEKRVAGLKPIPPLLTDIAARLSTLSRLPAGEVRVPDDLARLSEAIAQRARASQALFDSLEGQLARLPRGVPGREVGLTADQQRALAKLVDDLESLTVDSSLPRLVESLSDLPSSDVVSRLARAPASA